MLRKIIGITLIVGGLLLVGIGLGQIYFAHEKTVEKNVCQFTTANFTFVEPEKKIFESITVAPTPTPNKKFEGRWGGIANNMYTFPVGTEYDVKESNRIGKRVATGNEKYYIFLGGYWFSKEEYNNIPDYYKISNSSPYAN